MFDARDAIGSIVHEQGHVNFSKGVIFIQVGVIMTMRIETRDMIVVRRDLCDEDLLLLSASDLLWR